MNIKSNIKSTIYALCFLAISGCGGHFNGYSKDDIDPHDRSADLSRKEYVDEMFNKKNKLQKAKEQQEIAELKAKEPPLPKLSEILLAPKRPKIGVSKIVTLSVTEDIELKDVFVELAREADIDIEVDPKISGGVIFKAKNKPFDEVVQRICDLAGLRYTVNNGVLRIETDTPYIENYEVDFPNITRSNSGSVTVNVGGSGGGSSGSSGSGSSTSSTGSESGSGSSSGGGGITSGSSNSITSSYDGDLWASVEKDINAIIGTSESGESATFVSVNKQAGTITVAATQKSHLEVREYLNRVQQYTSSQVLIEAKVVEVSLSDKFQTGIDWRAVTDIGNGININTAIPAGDGNLPDVATIGLSRDNGNLAAAVQLAENFGTLRTLSSPRILVLNNQQAVLSFAKNQIYFTLDVQTDTVAADTGGGGTTTTTVDSTLNTIPVGLILTLQPSINEKTGDVLMNIRPTVTRLTGNRVSDPAVAFAAQNNNVDIVSEIPEVEVREMDSVLRLRTAEVMAIGGMIEQRVVNTDQGIPYLSDVPLVGNAFKQVSKDNNAIQTVIFLKATIVPSYGVDKEDQKFYKTFESDPRPLAF